MKILVLISIFISTPILAQSYLEFERGQKSLVHIVKKGETLGQILNDYNIHNIYKNKDKNMHLNPIHLTMWKNGLSKNDLKKLEPGQVIYLPIIASRGIASFAGAKPIPVTEKEISDKEIKKFVIDYAESYDD